MCCSAAWPLVLVAALGVGAPRAKGTAAARLSLAISEKGYLASIIVDGQWSQSRKFECGMASRVRCEPLVDINGGELSALLAVLRFALPPVTAVVDSNLLYFGLAQLGEERTTSHGYAWTHFWKKVWRPLGEFGGLCAEGLTVGRSAAAHGRLGSRDRQRLLHSQKTAEGVAMWLAAVGSALGGLGATHRHGCAGEYPGSIDTAVLAASAALKEKGLLQHCVVKLLPMKESELQREVPRLACLLCGATGAARASSFAAPCGAPSEAGKVAPARLEKRSSPGAVQIAVGPRRCSTGARLQAPPAAFSTAPCRATTRQYYARCVAQKLDAEGLRVSQSPFFEKWLEEILGPGTDPGKISWRLAWFVEFAMGKLAWSSERWLRIRCFKDIAAQTRGGGWIGAGPTSIPRRASGVGPEDAAACAFAAGSATGFAAAAAVGLRGAIAGLEVDDDDDSQQLATAVPGERLLACFGVCRQAARLLSWRFGDELFETGFELREEAEPAGDRGLAARQIRMADLCHLVDHVSARRELLGCVRFERHFAGGGGGVVDARIASELRAAQGLLAHAVSELGGGVAPVALGVNSSAHGRALPAAEARDLPPVAPSAGPAVAVGALMSDGRCSSSKANHSRVLLSLEDRASKVQATGLGRARRLQLLALAREAAAWRAGANARRNPGDRGPRLSRPKPGQARRGRAAEAIAEGRFRQGIIEGGESERGDLSVAAPLFGPRLPPGLESRRRYFLEAISGPGCETRQVHQRARRAAWKEPTGMRRDVPDFAVAIRRVQLQECWEVAPSRENEICVAVGEQAANGHGQPTAGPSLARRAAPRWGDSTRARGGPELREGLAIIEHCRDPPCIDQVFSAADCFLNVAVGDERMIRAVASARACLSLDCYPRPPRGLRPAWAAASRPRKRLRRARPGADRPARRPAHQEPRHSIRHGLRCAGLSHDRVAHTAAPEAMQLRDWWASLELRVAGAEWRASFVKLAVQRSVLKVARQPARWDDALQQLHRLEAQGTMSRHDIPMEFYGSVLDLLFSGGRWREGLHLMTPLGRGAHPSKARAATEAAELAPRERRYAMAASAHSVRACSSGGRWRLAAELAALGEQRRRLPRAVAHELALQCACKGLAWRSGLLLLDRGALAPLMVPGARGRAAAACSSVGRWGHALALVKSSLPHESDADGEHARAGPAGGAAATGPAPGTGLAGLTTALERGTLWASALGALHAAGLGGLRRTIATYGAMARAHARARTWLCALQVFRGARGLRLRVDSSIVSFAMYAGCRSRDGGWKSAVELFEQMRRSGLPAESADLDLAISGFGTAAQWPGAVALLADRSRDAPRALVPAASRAAGGRRVRARKRVAAGDVGEGAAPAVWPTAAQAARPCARGAGQRGPVALGAGAPRRHGPARRGGRRGRLRRRVVGVPRRRQVARRAGAGVRGGTSRQSMDKFYRTGSTSDPLAGDAFPGGEELARSLGSQSRWAQPADKQARDKVCDTRWYTKRMQAHARARQWMPALRLLDEMKAKGIPPDVITYSTLISACEKGKQTGRALELFEQMQTEGIVPDVITYNTAISACEKGRQSTRAWQLFEQMQKQGLSPNVITYNTLISACEKGKQTAQAFSLFQRMQLEGLRPDVITYNALISACEKGKRAEQALVLFERMRGEGVTPSVVTYSALISACEKGRLTNRALALWDEMKEQGLAPNVITYSALISACEKGKQVDKALEVFHEMRLRGVAPDIVTYNALISACEKCCCLKQALEVFDEMKARRVTPNVITYSALISACENSKQLEKAFALFEEMMQQGVVPDVITYNALISACEKAKELTPALELFTSMQGRGITPNVITYTALVSACMRAQAPEKAMELCLAMRKQGLKPDFVTYTALVWAAPESDQPEQARRLLRSTRDLGLPADPTAYAAVISTCQKGQQSQFATDLFEEMQREGLTPDVCTYNALIGVWWGGEGREIPRALLDRARRGREKCQQLPRALELFDEMKRKGLSPEGR
ncbi:unnamed protein product [Prorocentrum cordatum]|uniref:PROP1-like PPR domain-containing protein n=1 Tax=Prorocentrum cordatum TaxID=2364126 RepID=A0ABN9X796_9DINO|nr:unnamed protein product [Polarella glacialis]